MKSGVGAFSFIVDRNKLRELKLNYEQEMPLERQVPHIVPKKAIVGIQIGKEGFLDKNKWCQTLLF